MFSGRSKRRNARSELATSKKETSIRTAAVEILPLHYGPCVLCILLNFLQTTLITWTMNLAMSSPCLRSLIFLPAILLLRLIRILF